MLDNTTLNGISLADIGVKPAQKQAKQGLGQEDFMKLLLTQLKHQDPLQPQENGEFIAQMAQFGTLDGIQRLGNTFSNIENIFKSNQALQASSLVGREVLQPTAYAQMDQGAGISGQLDLPQTVNDLSVNIYDSAGKLVKSEFIGIARQGKVPYAWDGKDSGGSLLGSGEYRIEAKATFDGQLTAVATELAQKVTSVMLAPEGQVSLNLNNGANVKLADVTAFK